MSAPEPAAQDADRINALPAAELTELLLQCLAVPRWAHELAAGRPYADRDALLARADALAAGLADAEVQAAVADHPRIGERPSSASTTAALSAAEQSGVDSRDATLAERLAAGNADYERRFGHIYLVCASGRDGAEILADLRSRLANPPATELAVVRAELGKIAHLRLAGLR
ncbi:MAG TPA: 2-oxo-4-hydroxy-4-carboxy-5-ureidoimidazoline decarboxylase [Pseudonocardiaceae bacterium]|jgi:2-oxo-4-hydroxy-4-carboxy-5-ureidoimidazoline decarboxylase|nr:2-oxo-4-hydroxy-4-carboxy-5-ureidoimidazoline decarboxylase [Pseudonocardiaceae bacterium]